MLTLASASAIRKALLDRAGIAATVTPARVNERELEADALRNKATPAGLARFLAEAKCLAAAGTLVLGADQVLELEGAVLHKPADMAAARARLDALRGRTHALHAGLALARDGRLLWSTVVTSRLTMHAFSDAERDAYLAAEGEVLLSSVGAYRYEERGMRLFDSVEGDYFAILGLPLLPLIAALRRHAPEVLEGFT